MAPTSYLQSLDSKKHLVLICDDDSVGRKIEFDFIKKGLEKNEISIYITHGQVKSIENQMESFGIDVNYFKKKGILQIINIGNPAEGTLGFIDSLDVYLKKILPDPAMPFRIVGRAMPDVGMPLSMAIQAKWEKIFHHGIFDKLNGSILCTYDLSQIQANNEWVKWIGELQENHHAYIIHKNGKTTLTINAN